MKKTVLLMSVLSLALLGCEKENDDKQTPPTVEKKDCEKNNSGYVTINNTSGCDYNIFVSIAGGGFNYCTAVNKYSRSSEIEMTAKSSLVFKCMPKSDNTYPTLTWSSFFLTQCSEQVLKIDAVAEKKDCEKNNSGYITINNTTGCDYNISVSISGGAFTYCTTVNKFSKSSKVEMTAGSSLVFRCTPRSDNTYPTLTWTSFFLTQCSEQALEIDDKRQECLRLNYGYLTLNNNSSNPYDVYINNEYYGRMDGKASTNKIKYTAGKTYNVRVLQVSGYILYPTEKTYAIGIAPCDDKTITFP